MGSDWINPVRQRRDHRSVSVSKNPSTYTACSSARLPSFMCEIRTSQVGPAVGLGPAETRDISVIGRIPPKLLMCSLHSASFSNAWPFGRDWIRRDSRAPTCRVGGNPPRSASDSSRAARELRIMGSRYFVSRRECPLARSALRREALILTIGTGDYFRVVGGEPSVRLFEESVCVYQRVSSGARGALSVWIASDTSR